MLSFLGLFVLMGLAWLLSSRKRRLSWRAIGAGLALQFLVALAVLKWEVGRTLFALLGAGVRRTLAFVDEGSSFVFGGVFSEAPIAFKVLPTIIFFSALMAVLYHLRLIQPLVGLFSWAMRKTLGTSGAESLAAAANIFVGQTEAPLVVRPYIQSMTRSEVMSLMVGGYATVAGGVLAAYVEMGVDPTHLLTASIISAPAALLMAKILEPETGHPETLGRSTVVIKRDAENLLHAVTLGTTSGVKLAVNVGAMLLVFLAMIAMLNFLVAAVMGDAWSFERLLGYGFAPLAWTMGISWDDCQAVGQLLGIKTATNEFLAFDRLVSWEGPESTVTISERSRVIATYALCGFANFGSIGVQLGGMAVIAPSRQAEFASLSFRAMIGGTLAGFMTACVVGILL